MVTIEAISNSNGSTLLSVLQSRLAMPSVRSVRAAVSFLMASGAAKLKADFKRLVNSGIPVTIIFGDDFHLTQSAALGMLMAIGCDLRLNAAETHVGYHPKLWVIDHIDARTVIVGSSNLSSGGLQSNAEANVLIHGPAVELDAFEKMWTNFELDSHEFTAEDLKSYVDSEKAAAVPPPPRASASSSSRLRAHIERWQRFIADPHRIGQSERWRGWYLVPEQGQLTGAKLKELQQILEALSRRPQYRREGMVSFGADDTGVANAVAVLRAAGVTTSHSFSDVQRRNLFVRQQRLYLRTFGWLEQIDQEHFRISRAVESLGAARTDAERTRIFTEAISLKKWPFGPLAFYPFLVELLTRVPDHRLYYDEMNLIVIHSYHRAELAGIANLVTAYRGLSASDRASLSGWADEQLRTLLKAHAGGTAYGRYRRKVADLLVAFGNTTGLELQPAVPEDHSYLQLI